MATADERRALVFLAVLAAAGGLVRVVRDPESTPAAPVAPELRGEDVAAQAARSLRAEWLARPLAPGERVDVDRATADELERLPRVGPELARRIAEDRELHGPFGSLQGLGRVPGVGVALLRTLQRVTTFSGTPRKTSVPLGTSAPEGEAGCPGNQLVAVNRASRADLICLPGIGPALADRILEERRRHGPFRSPGDLERVPGIGPALSRRLAPRISVP